MKILLKNGSIVNVFTDSVEKADVLIQDGKIIGVGNDYTDDDAQVVEDVSGKYICPAFVDGHIHIESTMLTPYEFAKVCVPHGTSYVVADPHEITNVLGTDGIDFMMQSSKGLPLDVLFMLPSCVPATPLDEAGATLLSKDLEPYYQKERVLGLAEMMNYPGILADDENAIEKVRKARSLDRVVNGHAPLLTGRGLDKYISEGIQDDHECSSKEEALEKLSKGQWVMIRQGTAARNLEGLISLFDEPYSRRCLLVTDDKHPADLINNGHIDSIIRQAVKLGKKAVTGIRMATLQAAQCFNLKYVGAVAPCYKADLLVLDDLDSVKIKDVYKNGKKVVSDGKLLEIEKPCVDLSLLNKVKNSVNMQGCKAEDFVIKSENKKCRVIKIIKNQLLTEEWITDIDFNKNNGVDTQRDILKLAAVERHKNTG
ncbi:MAG: amidohydrolase family protein, partial [Clostridiales bacterium]|nr:amidohydrolase family protein [Clostridiales bacterium]